MYWDRNEGEEDPKPLKEMAYRLSENEVGRRRSRSDSEYIQRSHTAHWYLKKNTDNNWIYAVHMS